MVGGSGFSRDAFAFISLCLAHALWEPFSPTLYTRAGLCLPVARECGDSEVGTFYGDVLRLGCPRCFSREGGTPAAGLTFFCFAKRK